MGGSNFYNLSEYYTRFKKLSILNIVFIDLH